MCLSWVIAEIEEHIRTQWISLLCENIINEGRRLTKHASTSKFGPLFLWHAVTLGSPMCADHGRPPVPLTNTARNVGGPTVPKDLFEYKDDDCSIPNGDLQDLTSEKPSWPTMSPKFVKETGLATTAISKSYVSLLVMPGMLVLKATEKVASSS